MARYVLLCAFVGCLIYPAWSADPPPMPKPEKEHEWLKMFEGEWEGEGECFMEPDKPMKCKNTETCKTIGGFWIQSNMKADMAGMPINGIMTVGYDPARKKFVGNWVDSCFPFMWVYEGSVDSTGKILTLESEGPNMTEPGKMAKYRDVTEFKSADHKIMTSYVEKSPGEWMKIMSIESKKKKK